MLRILIADDHVLIRRGLKSILSEQLEPSEVVEAADGPAVLEALKETPCDLLVLDIAMPRMTGLRVLEIVKRQYPKLPVIILSAHAAAPYVQQSLKLGAAGYLCKESADAELMAAIRAARSGHTYISQVLRDTVH